ncbi:MAG: LPS export ABC transporter periplasmic protein LptC [Candidatus Eisenbacteria bacterium]
MEDQTSDLVTAGRLPGGGRLDFRLRRFLLTAAAFVVVFTCLPGCGKEPGQGTGKSVAEVPDQEVSDFSLTESVEGKKRWTLWAAWAAIFNENAKVHATNVRIDFFGDDGTKFSELRAESGVLDQKTNDMEAVGNVFVKTTEGVAMETQSLRWLNAPQKIMTDDFVKITQGSDVLTGVGLISDPSLNEFEIKSDVRAFVIDKDGRLIPRD